ncbi:MAG: hypothetical protein E6K76_09040 [Candidatus Eisenbacteria bacterium]|uniref:Uncharacterized protein n=1 Tax=Eiseniibacteriota bacterium TaxID=2212470 RepID=A0A538T343_UNCEI|nr:MAG: hypothetical protein E6K76_09040 [Candidatus Eisenbacteria bacterium]
MVVHMPTLYVGVIGDIVRSRQIAPHARSALQRRIGRTLQQINSHFALSLAAKFLITIGDEFQGLLRDPVAIPDLVRELEMNLPNTSLRLGIGRGALYTDLGEYAIGMDGPAWYAARGALEDARASRRFGGVFVGFGPKEDQVLNGMARVLHHVRSRLTMKQRELLEALLQDETQAEIATREGISKQAVSKRARAGGLEAYREAEAAWKLVLAATKQRSPSQE